MKLVNGKGKVLYKDFGELLFTHFGVSGPTVLSASCHLKAGRDTDRPPAQSLQKNQPCVHLDFRFPPFRQGDKSFLLF